MLRTFLRTLHATTPLWRAVWPWTQAPQPWDSQNPIREELFGVERLEGHARSLAKAQPATVKPTRGHSLVAQLRKNGAALRESYQDIQGSIDEGHAITPAAEWLLDNFHLVEEQIREIRDDLPPGYYRQLPKLAAGPFAGYPRVFGLAWAFVAHTDSRFDPDMLLPLRARLPGGPAAHHRRAMGGRDHAADRAGRKPAHALAERSCAAASAREAGGRVADRLLGVDGRTAEPISRCLLAMSERAPCRSLRRSARPDGCATRIRTVTPALIWLDQRLAAQGMTADDLVHEEHQRQGAASVTVRNIITSMRLVSASTGRSCSSASAWSTTCCADGSEFRGDGFPDAQSLPQRDRRTGARSSLHGTRHRAGRAPGSDSTPRRTSRGRERSRSRLSPDRRRAPRLRDDDRLSGAAAAGPRGCNRSARHRRLCGRSVAGVAASCLPRPGLLGAARARPAWLWPARRARRRPGGRSGGRAGQPT